MKNRVAEVRKVKNITQEVLARDVNITRPYLSKIERGIVNPSGNIVIRIADRLDRSVEYLFGTNGVNHNEQNLNLTDTD